MYPKFKFDIAMLVQAINWGWEGGGSLLVQAINWGWEGGFKQSNTNL